MIDDNKAISQSDRALTFKEAKTLYGIPEHRMRQYRSQRALDFFKLGRAVFVSERSLIKFLERHREPATDPGEGSGGR
jgi:Helix-turn-helix domain